MPIIKKACSAMFAEQPNWHMQSGNICSPVMLLGINYHFFCFFLDKSNKAEEKTLRRTADQLYLMFRCCKSSSGSPKSKCFIFLLEDL